MMSRILLVTPDYPPPPGGIQTIVRNLEQGLTEAGHTVEVLHIDPNGHDRRLGDFIPRPQWCYTARATATGQFVYLNAVAREARTAIERFNPDVVHAMHVRVWPALVAASEQGIPTILTTYALELEERTLSAKAIADADVVHAISDFTRSLVEDAARGAVETRVIPPSIQVENYRSARVKSDDPGPVVTLARFVERKNIETVIRAWNRIDPAQRGDRDLVVAGDGPRRAALEELAADVPDVRFVGWVNGAEKYDLLGRADAFCMVPRRREFDVEGFGIVYIEAQAAGVPVVGSKHGGAPEAIGEAGVVVDDEDDPEEVARAIQSVLPGGERREDCLVAAADRIDGFDVPVVTNRIASLYAELS